MTYLGPPAQNRYISLALLLLLAMIALLFMSGFLLGEDSLGGGVRMDLYLYHGPTMFAFRAQPWRQVLANYTSATTPLFHIAESLNPLLGDDLLFRAFNVLVGLSTIWLFQRAMLTRFCDQIARPWPATLIAASFLLSPYFRAETYWVSTDILPILLLILCSLMIIGMQDDRAEAVSPSNAFVHIAMLSVASWSAFYCRQTYLYLPVYAFGLLVVYRRPQRWFTILINVLFILPAIWLFWLWKGLNPPAFQHHEQLSINGVVAPLSMIFVYALPFAVEVLAFQRSLFQSEWQRIKRWMPWAVTGWAAFVATFHNYHFSAGNLGGGVASKLLSRFGRPGEFVFLTCAYLGLLIVAWLMLRSRTRGRGLVLLFLLPTFSMSVAYQRYYDPILFVLFFLFVRAALVRHFVSVRMGVILIAFSGLLLISAFTTNGRTKPVFWPVTSQNHPWTGTPLEGKVH